MKQPNIIKLIAIVIVTLFILVGISCSTSKNTTGNDLGDLGEFQVEKSGAVLWGENCSRCHNTPDPTAFSDVQWETIGTHMRIRAGLTGEDAKKIIGFLQQSN